MRTIDAAKVEGIGWSVYQLDGTELGHQAIPSDILQFQSVNNSLVKLALVYRRPLGSTPIEGTVAVTKLSMERIP